MLQHVLRVQPFGVAQLHHEPQQIPKFVQYRILPQRMPLIDLLVQAVDLSGLACDTMQGVIPGLLPGQLGVHRALGCLEIIMNRKFHRLSFLRIPTSRILLPAFAMMFLIHSLFAV